MDLGRSAGLPIYESIKRSIRDRIERGELAAGDRVPGEQELAEQLSVSRSQTRQALRDLEMEGYLLRERGRGSFVAPESRRRQNHRPRSTLRTVAIVYPRGAADSKTAYFHSFFQGLTRALTDHNVHPMIYYLDVNSKAELEFLQGIRDSGLEGLAIWPQFRGRQEIDALEDLCLSSFPCVLFDRYLPGIEMDFVGTANRRAYERLTRELIHRGRTTFAYLARDFADSVMDDRLAGFRRALDKHNLPFHAELVLRPKENPDAAIEALIHHHPCPDALVCSDDWTAGMVVPRLAERGIQVPGDAELATMNDALGPDHPETLPWVTAVQDGVEIGRNTAELLLSRIAQPQKPVEQRFVPAHFLLNRYKGARRRDAVRNAVKGEVG